MQLMEKFIQIADNPYAYAEKIKHDSRAPLIGYFCSYVPEEIICAAGAVPFRLFGTRGDISLADAHLQSYCCSLARGGLEDALNGSLSFLEGTVFPHTCDTIQRLSDIWRLNAGFSFHADIVLPVKLDTPSAREYMTAVLRDFRDELAADLNVPITEEALAGAIDTFNGIRKHLGELYAARSKTPGLISAGNLYKITKAAMVMDRKEAAADLSVLAGDLLSSGSTAQESAAGNRKRIILSGGICNHPDIYSLMEAAGADVVWDDLCTGTRYVAGPVSRTGDPIAAIAERYLERMVCPAKHSDNTARGRSLVETVQTHNADGVVFLFLKFCDPHAFDYPYLKQFLDEAGIPSMVLEMEERLPSEGQMKTRIESFVEMI
jgi:bcr-type benzoyl-CoA reductase subunit C